MPDLSETAITAWLARLPDDVRGALVLAEAPFSEGSGGLSRAVAAAKAADLPDVVRLHPEDVVAFGRPRRVRLMAWLAKDMIRRGENPIPAFRRLSGEEGGQGDGGDQGAGADAVGLLFLEDLRALADAVAPRLGRRIASQPSIEQAAEAVFVLESDMAFRSGGV